MKLFIAVVLILAVVAAESFPNVNTKHNTIATLFKPKEHVDASPEFEAIHEAYFQTIAKSEESVWRAAKEVERILAAVENTQVAKDVARSFYIAYDVVLYSTASTYNQLNPEEPLTKTALRIQDTVSNAATRILQANIEINIILRDNAPDVLPKVGEINVRAGNELDQHLEPLIELLTPYFPKH